MSLLGQRSLPDWPEEPDEQILSCIVDTHAHPTDYKRFLEQDAQYRAKTAEIALAKLCAMSSNLGDQDLVRQLATEHPGKIVAAFGLHPWWSHHISFADTLPSKVEHYSQVFPAYFDDVDDNDQSRALFDSFPEPTLYVDYEKSVLVPYLTENHPSTAMLGEVGLDRSFRIPAPKEEAKTQRDSATSSSTQQADGGDNPVVDGGSGTARPRKKLTTLHTPIQHQVELLERQLRVAMRLDRNISMHSVQAQAATVELAERLSRSPEWKASRAKLCMHSYGGSADTIQRLHRILKDRVYFSFSTTINARLSRLEELIRSVPDDRLLVESDFNDIRLSSLRVWEILGIVCDAKGWDAKRAADQLQRNWQSFSSSVSDDLLKHGG